MLIVSIGIGTLIFDNTSDIFRLLSQLIDCTKGFRIIELDKLIKNIVSLRESTSKKERFFICVYP